MSADLGPRRRSRSSAEQWFAYDEGMRAGIEASAGQAVERTGRPQRVHLHYQGERCSKGCHTIKPKRKAVSA